MNAKQETPSRKVPFFNYQHIWNSEEEKFLEIMRDVGRRGAFIMQKDLTEFEEKLAQFSGCKYALGVADGTEAITIALLAAGLKAGDEVIFASHTMVATAAAIHFAGGIPVPIECGADHMMNPDAIEPAITPRTRAILPTQLNGRTCDMEKIMAIAQKHSLFVVEDAAQALGSKFKGQCAGTFGAAGTLSFYPAKSLGCFGDGGGILTNDPAMYESMKLLRDHGRDHNGEVVVWGFNSRLDNLQAAILGYKLQTFDKVIERRRAIATIYQKQLGNLRQLQLPPAPGSEVDHFDTFQNYEVEADERDALKVYLAEHGVGTLIQWGGKAVHQFPKLGLKGELPFTDKLFERCLMLPLNMSMSDDDVKYVCEAVVQFFRTRK